MPDIFYLLSNWWKQVLAIVLLSLLTAGTILFFKKPEYLSTTTALPASSLSADKGRLFNENIQSLYSVLGTTDELDMITGTGQLDTVYLAVTDLFNLADHYKTSDDARTSAAHLLKKNSKVMKSDYGELKIKVWDTDKTLAPQLANAIMDVLQSIHQHLQNEANTASLALLRKAQADGVKAIDSIDATLQSAGTNPSSTNIDVNRRQTLLQQSQQYDKMIFEYQLMLDSRLQPLLVVEKARASSKADRPKTAQVLIITGFLSLLFGLLSALVLERKKMHSQQ